MYGDHDSISTTVEKFVAAPGLNERIAAFYNSLPQEVRDQLEATTIDIIFSQASSEFEQKYQPALQESVGFDYGVAIFASYEKTISQLKDELSRLIKLGLEDEVGKEFAKKLEQDHQEKKAIISELYMVIPIKQKWVKIEAELLEAEQQFNAAIAPLKLKLDTEFIMPAKEAMDDKAAAEAAFGVYETRLAKLFTFLSTIRTQIKSCVEERLVKQHANIEFLKAIYKCSAEKKRSLHQIIHASKMAVLDLQVKFLATANEGEEATKLQKIMEAFAAEGTVDTWNKEYCEERDKITEAYKCHEVFVKILRADKSFLRTVDAANFMAYVQANNTDLKEFNQAMTRADLKFKAVVQDYINKRQPSILKGMVQFNVTAEEKIKWARVLLTFLERLPERPWLPIQKFWALSQLIHQLEKANQTKSLLADPGTHFPKLMAACKLILLELKEALPEIVSAPESQFTVGIMSTVALYRPRSGTGSTTATSYTADVASPVGDSFRSSSSRLSGIAGSFFRKGGGAAASSPAASANGGAGGDGFGNVC
ncbi:MAG: hypothetical protein K0S29_243 [Gammaproteobacteria bacterium]|jgi:hypothetical protein|nr:hypothetical protein [Gammaproteobacteria bacterium]